VNSLASSVKFRFLTNTPTSSLDPPPTRTRRPRGPPYASRLLSHHMWIPHPASASRVAPTTSAGPARRLPLHAGPARSPYPSTTRTPTPPRPRLGLQPPLRLLLGLRVRVGLRVGPRGSRVQGQLYRTTLIRTDFWAGYNVHTRREIRLLTRPQARRPDRWELTLRRLPRLASHPGGNTTRPS
jgi:hypothetical protein